MTRRTAKKSPGPFDSLSTSAIASVAAWVAFLGIVVWISTNVSDTQTTDDTLDDRLQRIEMQIRGCPAAEADLRWLEGVVLDTQYGSDPDRELHENHRLYRKHRKLMISVFGSQSCDKATKNVPNPCKWVTEFKTTPDSSWTMSRLECPEAEGGEGSN